MTTHREKYGASRKERLLFGVLLGLLAAALGGSVWAWAREHACGSCAGAGELLAGRSLAPLGVSFYSGLFALGSVFGRSRLLFLGILLAAAVHAVLLFHLAERGLFCRPCMLVGSSALLAGILSLVIDPDNLARGSVVLPIGGILTPAALVLLGSFPMPKGEAASAVPLPLALAEPQASVVTAHLLVFTRPGCRYCLEFEEQVLPELRGVFGDALVLERRPAPPGLPSPTLVVSGAARSVFPGLPPTSDLREAIRLALGQGNGKESHESPVLSQSR